MADDVIVMAHSVDVLQVLLDICAAWAAKNRLHWNPLKSQVLRVGTAETTQGPVVKLNGSQLAIADSVEYLGLMLTREGFKGNSKK